MENDIVKGVVIAVAAAFIIAMFGIDRDSNKNTSPSPAPATPVSASMCMTPLGGCPLMYPMAPGASCVCYDAFGIPRVAGTAQ